MKRIFAVILGALLLLGYLVVTAGANEDLPPIETIDHRCEDPAFMDFTAKIPTISGQKYPITLPENILACAAFFYDGDTLEGYLAGIDSVECLNGYCAEGLGLWNKYADGEARFWWTGDRPDRVRIYYRLLIPGEHLPDPEPDPEDPTVTFRYFLSLIRKDCPPSGCIGSPPRR
jgi:hypothetical protein